MQEKQPIKLTKSILFKYTLFSFIFAIITLFTVILPAEYNFDPTGIGRTLGFTVFNNVKIDNAIPIPSKLSKNAVNKKKWAAETIEIIVPALSGIEYKFTMQQYQKLNYQWKTNGIPLYFDLHGEPEGDTTGYFESYAIATLSEMKGGFTTPFSGVHGWYWKNTSNTAVTIQLTVKGEFQKHGLK